MACFAPKARANCVTALPIDPPIAGARTVLPARKLARVRATCAVRYATGIPPGLPPPQKEFVSHMRYGTLEVEDAARSVANAGPSFGSTRSSLSSVLAGLAQV